MPDYKTIRISQVGTKRSSEGSSGFDGPFTLNRLYRRLRKERAQGRIWRNWYRRFRMLHTRNGS